MEGQGRTVVEAIAKQGEDSTYDDAGRSHGAESTVREESPYAMGTADTMQASLVALSGQRRAGLSLAASLTVAEHILPRWLGAAGTSRSSASVETAHSAVRPV